MSGLEISVIILSILAILTMFFLILKFPILKIKSFVTDTFYLPILFVALLFLIFPFFNKNDLFNILKDMSSTLNPLRILILFISVSFISIALDETGFFKYIATIFIDKFKASQFALFIILYILVSVLTVFTSNDIVILTFTPFILYFSKRGNINPIPYLVMEFVAANTYSMMLSIGNPTNIYLASVYEISFLDYFLKMVIPAIFCGLSTFGIIILLFLKDLKKKISVFEMDKATIKNKPLCIIACIHLFLLTILLAISNYINIEMWILCLSFAVSLLIVLIIFAIKDHKKSYVTHSIRRVPYTLIPFVLSMFIIIKALDSYGIFTDISKFFASISNEGFRPHLYLITSTLSCNIVNNIPMSLAYGSILANTTDIKLVYATIIGSNLGAILTPVGALAGIMWLRILKANNVDYSFMKFVKNGTIITAVGLIASMLALLII